MNGHASVLHLPLWLCFLALADSAKHTRCIKGISFQVLFLVLDGVVTEDAHYVVDQLRLVRAQHAREHAVRARPPLLEAHH